LITGLIILFIVFLLGELLSNPDFKTETVLLILSLGLMVMLYLTRTEKDILLSCFMEETKELLDQGYCPFCEENNISEFSLRVGYIKYKHQFAYYVFWIEYGKKLVEYSTYVPICIECKEKFLLNELNNPSYKVLRQKKGYFSSLREPFDKNNLIKK
jgi:hypothetical protein